MSAMAIHNTTVMLRALIGRAVGQETEVHIGPPIRAEISDATKVSLFLFHLQVNPDLRNAQHDVYDPNKRMTDVRDALPLDLHYMITVFRNPQDAPLPNELEWLGSIIQMLHTFPFLSGEQTNGQVVRLTPEPYPMEELSRVWGLFSQDVYRTSMVYLASPVYVAVEPDPPGVGPVVLQRDQKSGPFKKPPDILGRRLEGVENGD